MKTAKFALLILASALLWFSLGWANPKPPVFSTVTRTFTLPTNADATTNIDIDRYGTHTGETGTLVSVRVELDYSGSSGLLYEFETFTSGAVNPQTANPQYSGHLAQTGFRTQGAFPVHPIVLLTDLWNVPTTTGSVSCVYDGTTDYGGSSGFTTLRQPPNANLVGSDITNSDVLAYWAGSGTAVLEAGRIENTGPPSGTCNKGPFDPPAPFDSQEESWAGGSGRLIFTATP